MNQSMSAVAAGDIVPNSIIKLSTTADNEVAQCGAGEAAYGIAGPGSRYAPWSALDDGKLAIAGENVMFYGDGAKGVQLRLGGTVVADDWLKSDASGFGVVSTTDREKVVGRARAGGTSGQIIPVDIMIGERSTA